MASLKTKYMGLELRSPIIAGSCGLTSDVNKMVEMEKAGVGAVVLKSIFEEQINEETSGVFKAGYGMSDAYPEAEDYIKTYIRSNTIQKYVDLVRDAKSRLTIPVIASVNCFSGGEWVTFARQLEEAGADALELNVFILPVNQFKESVEVENVYFDIVKSIKGQIKIPVAVKISHYFTNLSAFVDKIKAYGANATTIFNRFYEPDININTLEMGAASVFSTATELRTTLRWTGILAGKDKRLEISASTGVHSGEAAVKLLLAGATTVQVCSVLYERGIHVIEDINDFIGKWMDSKAFNTVEDYRGMLSYSSIENPDLYERAQFMKYFSNKQI
ncbi:dihydroorotate dehydrogenase-like protein [Odoribacter sp. AF15-53]|mgnify:FL=1|uniref:dihydroorotate dehydrogenase-like protein n=1 Tax=Odoribacter sp. AF15-53 TaxID=2292236 RepID=UPI000E4D866C|nr:dihydroorotate dehydrogenase-like protein [Odoribacter sp. AF15-53]RHR75481.1 dihydroorotate dehydrogenase-like protein [Odoribacter sp. AF15-53]